MIVHFIKHMFKELDILKPFLEDPIREFNVRELGRILKISPATASKKLCELEKEGYLKEWDERNLKLYKADTESEKYRDFKVYYNIRKIKDSGLIEYLNINYFKPTIILFGSASKGEDISDSDFDILIVAKNDEREDFSAYEKRINRKIHGFFVQDIKNLGNEHLINNVLRGITLQGGIEWMSKNA